MRLEEWCARAWRNAINASLAVEFTYATCVWGPRDIQRLVLCGDFNARSNVWSNNSVTDVKGEEVEGILLKHNMIVMNDPNSTPTFDSGRGQSWIDLTVCGDLIADKIRNWRVVNEESLSFHKMIKFDIQTIRTDSIVEKCHYNSTDWKHFNECLKEKFVYSNITAKMQVSDITELDELVTQITNIFTATIKSNVKSTKNYKQRNLVSWWSNEIYNLENRLTKLGLHINTQAIQ